MGRTIAYTRVSTNEQALEGHSLGAQADRCRQYAALHDLGEVEVFADEGISGGSMERPALQDLIALCQAGEVDHVIVVALDRLSRRVRDTLYLVTEVFDGRIAFHSIRDNFDTSTATGRFVLNIMASVNELERGLISERTSAALQAKRAKGEYLGSEPLGWVRDGDVLVENGEGQATLRRIRDLHEEGLSLRAIADTLIAEGHRTKRGGRWAAQTVKNALALAPRQ